MTKMRTRAAASAGVLALAAALSLTACATPAPAPEPTETVIGGDIVAPVELSYQDINGQTIDLVVGQVINIDYGGINSGEITVDISDPNVVEYTDAKFEDEVQYSAGLTALSGGESTVTFTFTGETPKELTVQVLLQ
jgi:hypothetical protein